MNYRLSFTGPASLDINHLLTAIEHRLNGHASVLMAGEDLPAAATEMKLEPCAKGQRPPCPDTDPREPWVIVHGAGLLLIVFTLGAVVGLGAGTMLALGKIKGR